MKKYWVLVLVMLSSIVADAQDLLPAANLIVQPGEVLTYKITYGFLTVGEAKIATNESIHVVDNKNTYKIDITGKTTGALGWVAKVDDKWGAYLNTKDLLPVKSYRIVRENNYKRDELAYFNHSKKYVLYQKYNHKTNKFEAPEQFSFTNTVRDLIGGYYFLRQIDYNKLTPGDTIHINGFFENDFYNFDILYKGKESIKTEFGKIAAIKLVPVMPKNKVFDGENSISLWLSDDANRIPLKAEANMFIGKAGCDIIRYENLKNKIVFAGK